MTDSRKQSWLGSLLASVLSLCGCGQPANPPAQGRPEATVTEEIPVSGFDADGEPVIRKRSDGSLWIHFEAMPPFFAEEDGTEAEFEDFESKLQDALGVPVRREDREVFVIANPGPDTAARAKAWLQGYRGERGRKGEEE